MPTVCDVIIDAGHPELVPPMRKRLSLQKTTQWSGIELTRDEEVRGSKADIRRTH
jgi:hypothetical protein